MAAAVADYRPAEPIEGKRPKDCEPWRCPSCRRRTSRALGPRGATGQVLVAFGAEHGEEGLARKRAMLTDKNVDLVVYNDVGRDDIGFDSPDNEVVLVSRDGERHVPKASKPAIAAAILDEVERLLGRTGRERAARRPARGPTADAAALAERVVANLGSAVHAPPETLRLPLLCLLAEGHVLVEDVPGVGKTVLAKALARSLDLTFHRVQFTPDLCSRRTSRGSTSSTGRARRSVPARARCSRTSCSSTRSTARRRRRSRRSSRRCRRPR